MKKIGMIVCLMLIMNSCKEDMRGVSIKSPDGQTQVSVGLNESDQAIYEVKFKDNTIVDVSTLGFEFTDATAFSSGLKIVNNEATSFNET